MKRNKIALFHPWIKSRGGAEQVVLEILKKSNHDIDIYTWAYDKENTFSEFEKYDINVIAPNFLRKIARLYLLRGMFLPISIFSKIPLDKYDKFLISTSGIAEFIAFRNYKKGQTYAYCHTPLREANKKIVGWNIKNKYEGKVVKKYIYLTGVKVYRFFEKKAWKKIDVVIFNSDLSKSRAIDNEILGDKKHHVIHPPINVSRFSKIKHKPKKNFLYWSRLNPPKRQDVLIEAWKKFALKNPGYKLIIMGTVDNKEYSKKLESLARGEKSIDLVFNASNKDIDKALASSVAGIFLGYQEDFGIVPLEILASKKPLIAVDEGGYVDLIKDNKLFHKIREKHDRGEMINRIAKELERFIKKKRTVDKRKILVGDFVKRIDEVLRE